MNFTINTNNVMNNGSTILPEGNYEVVISKVDEKTSNNGKEYINVELIVRNDIDQPYKNKRVWYKIWNTEATRASGMFEKTINTISNYVGIKNGAEFNSVSEWGNFLYGKAVIAVIKHETYNNEKTERVAFINESKKKNCSHLFPNTDNQIEVAENKEDDDMPF